MDILLVILGCLCLLIGLVGAIVPAVPGPPLSFLGLLLIHWSDYAEFPSQFLWIWAAITLVVTLVDYYLPAWMTKRFGGSRTATIGSVVGLIIGLFFAPVGLIVGPFLGALIGELIANAGDGSKALKVAMGAFVAFICGTGAKLIASAVMIFYAVRALII